MDNSEILTEIANRKNKRLDIAVMYWALFDHDGCDESFWRPINEAIVKRWSLSGLTYIKTFAWKLHDSTK